MITHSVTFSEVGSAIAAVQVAVDHVAKDQRNPHFDSSYADLNAFLRALKGPLAENGILMTQAPGMEDGRVILDTLILHMESGEWIMDRAAAPMQKNDPQGVGSAITYLRRYSLAALFAVPQEDDDGNAASERRDASGRPHRKPATKPSGDDITCPACAGPMWDNRDDEMSAVNGGKRPDLKCRDKECDTAIWLGSMRDNLRTALEQAVQADILTDAERQRVQGVIGAYKDNPAALFRASDWLRTKMTEAQT